MHFMHLVVSYYPTKNSDFMKSHNNFLVSKDYLKRLCTCLILGLTFVSIAKAQDFAIDLERHSNPVDVLVDNLQTVQIKYTYPGIGTFSVGSERGTFNEIFMPNTYWTGELGTPKLPASKDLIEVPFGSEVTIKVLNYSMNEYKLSDHGISNLLIPVQPSLRKDQDADQVPFEYKESVYQQDKFIGHELAQIEVLGVMRGTRIARLTIAPVSYNPVKGIIRVYNDIEIEVAFHNPDLALTEYIKASTYSPYFEVIQKSLLNKAVQSYPAHPDLTKYPVKYLIVSDRMFEYDLPPFIEWKTKKGFEVILAFTDVIGTSYAAIQTWVHAQYNAGTPTDPAPSFLLLVGDTPQIPATMGSSSNKMTDLYYGSVDGDYFPEMYYGRFSATNSAQLTAQINKTLYYERYEFADPSYLDRATLIAGADGTWNPRVGQPTIQYGANNYWNASNGFTSVNTYLTSPYTGCYDPARIAVSFINYTAHCGQTSWGDPLLSQSAVNAFVNNGQYPLAIGNCCLAADFGYAECIGETWQRAANKGSVAYIGSSPNSYWFEDFYWSVGAFPIQGTNDGYVPTYAETTWGAYDGPFVSDYVSAGAIVFVGNLAVTEVHIQGYPSHSSPLYYWQAYNVLGDPSLVAYHTQGSTNAVSHMPILPIGMNYYEVSATPGSYVAISKDGVLHGAALVGLTGIVNVPIDPVVSSGMVDIVVTKPQYIPYMVQVPAAALEGPYIVLDYYQINDINGNNNGLADYGESISLHVTLKNVGADPSGQVVVTLTGTDPYVALTGSAVQNFGIIINGGTATVNNAYNFNIADGVPDQYTATFTLDMDDGDGPWTSSLQLIVQAPALQFGNLVINDNIGGNGNGRLDPGETADIIVQVLNDGHSISPAGLATLTSASPWITVNTGTDPISPISAQGQTTVAFSVTADPATPVGTSVDLHVDVAAGNYGINHTFSRTVGLVLEDWETGNFASFPWTFGGNAPWTITSVGPYEGVYCAKSGTITHSQTTDLIVQLYVSEAGNISFYRKVSSETNYDYLRFFIDGIQQAQWAGEVAWGEVSFPVTTGLHTFMWRYYKDGSVSSGSDCAWIDYIVFPSIIPPPDPAEIVLNPLSFEVSLPVDADETKLLTIGNSGEELLSFNVIKNYIYSNKSILGSEYEPNKEELAQDLSIYLQALEERIAQENPVKPEPFEVINSGPTDSFCAPAFAYGCSGYSDGLTGFGLEQIQNLNSGCDDNTGMAGWSTYFNLGPAVLEAGQQYTVAMRSGYSNQFVNIWIDFNDDNMLTEDERILNNFNLAAANTWYNATITIPENALPGQYKMRAMAVWNSQFSDPCGSYGYGEAEDYTVLVNSNFVDWLTLDPTSGTVSGSGSTNVNLTFNSAGLEVGTYYANVTVTSNDPVTPTAIIPCTLHVVEEIVADLTVFLEGPFAGTAMNTLLSQSGHLSLTQPYNTAPWNYAGTENVAVIPNADVVDWVLLEFRDAPLGASSATPSTTVEKRAVFVLNDGSIVDLDGVSPVEMTEPIVNELFVVVRHRNHIPIMSSMQVTRTGNVYHYDFTDSAGKVYGGSSGYNEIAPGIWGLVSGDGLCDGVVDATDKTTVWNPEAGHSGYHNGDMNLDGQISNSDKSEHWLPNIGKMSQVPE
jgi:hypothetical protein